MAYLNTLVQCYSHYVEVVPVNLYDSQHCNEKRFFFILCARRAIEEKRTLCELCNFSNIWIFAIVKTKNTDDKLIFPSPICIVKSCTFSH